MELTINLSTQWIQWNSEWYKVEKIEKPVSDKYLSLILVKV